MDDELFKKLTGITGDQLSKEAEEKVQKMSDPDKVGSMVATVLGLTSFIKTELAVDNPDIDRIKTFTKYIENAALNLAEVFDTDPMKLMMTGLMSEVVIKQIMDSEEK